MKTGNAILI